MLNFNIPKQEFKNIYCIYKAISNEEFTPAQLGEVFENEAKEWKSKHKHNLTNDLHGHLSSMFEGTHLKNDAPFSFISRRKNTKGHWVYKLELKSEDNLTQCLNHIYNFLKQLELYIILKDGKVSERGINGKLNLFLSHEKIYELWDFYEKHTGELFEYAIID